MLISAISTANVKSAYRIALVCGAAPLLIGVMVYLLWSATGWEWLLLVGLFTIYSGLAAFFVGAAALARYCWLSFRREGLSQRKIFAPALICALLLVSNFPAAAAIVAAVVAGQTRYVVEVQNESPQPLTDARVFGGGCDVTFDTIPAKGWVRRTFWIEQDGQLDFEGFLGETKISKPIEGYVTKGIAGDAVVAVHVNGDISVVHVHRGHAQRRD